MATSAVTFIGTKARKMLPTTKHRPAVWECMLGTVYAMDDAGECRYFDYDHAAARAFAGVAADRDPRVSKITRDLNYTYVKSGAHDGNPGMGLRVLWITKRVP